MQTLLDSYVPFATIRTPVVCEACGAHYTEEQFLQLEYMGYNRIWPLEYRRCVCGAQLEAWHYKEEEGE